MTESKQGGAKEEARKTENYPRKSEESKISKKPIFNPSEQIKLKKTVFEDLSLIKLRVTHLKVYTVFFMI